MTDWIMQAVTVLAGFSQSVTGIGFGMIAGPIILTVMNDPTAIIISTLMSWLISVCLFPILRMGTDIPMLLRLVGGTALGAPFGWALLFVADVYLLKLVAGLVIGLLTLLMIFGAPGMSKKGNVRDVFFGALGGLFGASLAMPGPLAALRLGGLGVDKTTVRATMVSFFFCVWPVIFLGQGLVLAPTKSTFMTALILTPATLVGLWLGHLAASRISERMFRGLLLAFLLATSFYLLTAPLWAWMGETV